MAFQNTKGTLGHEGDANVVMVDTYGPMSDVPLTSQIYVPLPSFVLFYPATVALSSCMYSTANHQWFFPLQLLVRSVTR
jgi:hypothetical protein